MNNNIQLASYLDFISARSSGNSRKNRAYLIAGTLVLWGSLLPVVPASALTFEFVDLTQFSGTNGRPLNSQEVAAAQDGAQSWSDELQDEIVVRIAIGMSDLGSGALGGTTSATAVGPYSTIVTALSIDSSSTSDQTAVANLPAGSSLAFLTNDTPSTGTTVILDNDTTGTIANNNRFLVVTRANAKALNLLADDGATVDATLEFSTSYPFDFDRSDGLVGVDFTGVVAHEIAHALGFLSGVDTVDQVVGLGSDSGLADLDGFAVFRPLDLFRYSATSFSQGVLDLSVGGDPYFSIDGGQTSLVLFSTGAANGDGEQASHWKDTANAGIMDPTFGGSELKEISTVDLVALDVIGWDLVPVPEPAGLVIALFGLLGLDRYRWRSRSLARPSAFNSSAR